FFSVSNLCHSLRIGSAGADELVVIAVYRYGNTLYRRCRFDRIGKYIQFIRSLLSNQHQVRHRDKTAVAYPVIFKGADADMVNTFKISKAVFNLAKIKQPAAAAAWH